MDIYEHRRLRFDELIDAVHGKGRGRLAKAAQRIDASPDYVSRMLYEEGKAQKKRIMDGLVRKIEKGYQLEPHWLDMPMGHGIEEVKKRFAGSKAAATPPATTNNVTNLRTEETDAGPGPYVNPSWPFTKFTLEEFKRLDPERRSYAEDHIELDIIKYVRSIRQTVSM